MIRFMIFHVMLVFEPLTVKGLQNSVTPAAILPSAGGERDGVGGQPDRLEARDPGRRAGGLPGCNICFILHFSLRPTYLANGLVQCLQILQI